MGHEGGHGHGGHHGHDHDHAHDHHHDDHDRAHDHDDAHDHHHAHDHEGHREPLPRGAGVGKVLFLDAPSGLAGDMIVAALVDLGVPVREIEEGVRGLGVSGFHVHFGTKVRSGVVATAFDVHVDAGQPSRTYREVRELLDASAPRAGVKARAHRTFRRLAEAEAKVHRMALDDVHFHEVGAVDAIVDVVGSAIALDYVGAEVVVSPLPMGRGFVSAAARAPAAPGARDRRMPRGPGDIRRGRRLRVRDADGRGHRRRARACVRAMAGHPPGASRLGRGNRRPGRPSEPPAGRARLPFGGDSCHRHDARGARGERRRRERRARGELDRGVDGGRRARRVGHRHHDEEGAARADDLGPGPRREGRRGRPRHAPRDDEPRRAPPRCRALRAPAPDHRDRQPRRTEASR